MSEPPTEHVLTDGRVVILKHFELRGTYSGQMEGSRASGSVRILESLPEFAARMLDGDGPVVVIPSPTMPLPDWLCLAELESDSAAKSDDPDMISRLRLCWFVTDTTRSVDSMVSAVLPFVDWEAQAEDFDIMNF